MTNEGNNVELQQQASGSSGIQNSGSSGTQNLGSQNSENVNSVFGKMPFPQLQAVTNIEMFFTKLENWFILQGLGIRKEN